MNNLRSPIFRLAKHRSLPLVPLKAINPPSEAERELQSLRESVRAMQTCKTHVYRSSDSR
jgi:hypothetical protein